MNMTRYQGFLLYYYYYYIIGIICIQIFMRSKHAWPYLGDVILGVSVTSTKMGQVFCDNINNF